MDSSAIQALLDIPKYSCANPQRAIEGVADKRKNEPVFILACYGLANPEQSSVYQKAIDKQALR